MIDDSLYIAVDLGAGSGRIFLVDITPDKFTLEEVRRFTYPASQLDGNLRWDFTKIFAEIKAGLTEAGRRSRELGRHILSIGVDSWAVDYGLIDAAREFRAKRYSNTREFSSFRSTRYFSFMHTLTLSAAYLTKRLGC